MKKGKIIFVLFLALIVTGCEKEQNLTSNRTNQSSSGMSEIEQAKAQEDGVLIQTEFGEDTITAIPTPIEIEATKEPEVTASSDINLDSDIIEITDKLFITQVNDVYYNYEDYLGKTITYEGIFDSVFLEETNQIYYNVIRYGPGCCFNDASAGFEVAWEDDSHTYPKQNDWVRVVGVLDSYEEDGNLYLQLMLKELTVLQERGNEYVEQ